MAGIHFADAHSIGQVADFGLPIAGHEHHFVKQMFRFQMTDERRAFRPRFIAKSINGGVNAIDQNDAFQAAGSRRQVACDGRLFRRQSIATGDLNRPSIHRSTQPGTGRFADFTGLANADTSHAGRREDGAGQRVL